MKKTTFNYDWKVFEGIANPFGAVFGADPLDNAKKVTLPDDAMIREQPEENDPNGTASGFYPSKTYTYTKKFTAPKEWQNKQIIIEFEGVMAKAKVYLNDNLIATNENGYQQFYVNLSPYLKYNTENQLQVTAINEPNSSRWYTGAGIYRNVNLFVGSEIALKPNALKISTPEIDKDEATVIMEASIKNTMRQSKTITVKAIIEDNLGKSITSDSHQLTIRSQQSSDTRFRLTVNHPNLWSPENPNLYTVKIILELNGTQIDETTDKFGIRKLQLDAKHGLRINGKTTKLRGACIHHTNGIIGAATYRDAEFDRCRKLKEAGFNAIRSSHAPMSKEMLAACDELGMLVMDELSDFWNIPKGANDGSFEFEHTWRSQINSMVEKDYNHPCVVMYCLGNEIPEIGREQGRVQIQKLNQAIHKKDPYRYTTIAINGMLGFIGAGSEALKPVGEAFQNAFAKVNQQLSQDDSGDKDQLNSVMGDITDEQRDALTISNVEDQQLEEVEDNIDIIGYNYMPARYEHHHTLHPSHIMLGSESYAREIPNLWAQVTKHPYVLGDFTWTGYDYLGEAGIGAYHYNSRSDMGFYPDKLAYCGDIDLTGYRRPVSYLREIVYGLRTKPYIAVSRVDKFDQPVVLNHWKYEDVIHSWTFPGYEDSATQVFVMSKADTVELLLNNKSLGKKAVNLENNFTAKFDVHYQPGALKAISYDKDGNQIGIDEIKTANHATEFLIDQNKSILKAANEDLLILEINLVDDQGRLNMWEEHQVSVDVSDAGKLIGLGSADPQTIVGYQATTFPTYDGRVLAVIRASRTPGDLIINIKSPNVKTKKLTIKVQ